MLIRIKKKKNAKKLGAFWKNKIGGAIFERVVLVDSDIPFSLNFTKSIYVWPILRKKMSRNNLDTLDIFTDLVEMILLVELLRLTEQL